MALHPFHQKDPCQKKKEGKPFVVVIRISRIYVNGSPNCLLCLFVHYRIINSVFRLSSPLKLDGIFASFINSATEISSL